MSAKTDCIYDVRLVQGPVTYEPPDAGMYIRAYQCICFCSRWTRRMYACLYMVVRLAQETVTYKASLMLVCVYMRTSTYMFSCHQQTKSMRV
jgi:hypothetical protein